MPDLYELYNNLRESAYVGSFIKNYGLVALTAVITTASVKLIIDKRKLQKKLEDRLK